MSGKLVFFDIDGTLWDRQQRIPASAAEGIRRLRENGHQAFINTGRVPSYLHYDSLDALGFDGVVAACGWYIWIGGQLMREKWITSEELKRSMAVLEEAGAMIIAEGPDYQWYDEERLWDDTVKESFRRGLGGRGRPLESLTPADRVTKYLASFDQAEKAEAASRALADIFDTIYHIPTVLELVPRGNTKATGLRFVADYFGAPREDLYAFGDGMNDMEMIQAVGHGIAMGNGMEVLKREAEYVTASLENDGILKALEHYQLI